LILPAHVYTGCWPTSLQQPCQTRLLSTSKSTAAAADCIPYHCPHVIMQWVVALLLQGTSTNISTYPYGLATSSPPVHEAWQCAVTLDLPASVIHPNTARVGLLAVQRKHAPDEVFLQRHTLLSLAPSALTAGLVPCTSATARVCRAQ
jgi:hypothetical protein